MKELKEVQFQNGSITLNTNRVKGSILPRKTDELDRDLIIQCDTVVEGAVYGYKIEVKNGDVDVEGALYAQKELHINSDATGTVKFRKSVGTTGSIVSHARNLNLMFLADINAKEVRLNNAYVAGSIFADDITLVNCVVIGGLFATQNLDVRNSIVGTFNSPQVTLDGEVSLLLPSAFSIEEIKHNPATTKLYNLSLADLGNLFRHLPQLPNTGRIEMSIENDEQKSVLNEEDRQLLVRSYTVIGKVLAASLLDWDKMQNFMLLTAASLSNQLLKNYDLGSDSDGNKAELSPETISKFFFELLEGKHEINAINGDFSIDNFADSF